MKSKITQISQIYFLFAISLGEEIIPLNRVMSEIGG